MIELSLPIRTRYPFDRLGNEWVAAGSLVRSLKMIDMDYPALLNLFPEHLDKERSESASFLIWYLEHYYRLDPVEAVDSVCDQKGDKGIDGIFVNDNDQTITVFQSKISQRSNVTIGDASLREFSGTLSQFASVDQINNLISSTGNAEVASLIKRLDLVNKIATHDVLGEFVANVDLDANGAAFLRANPNISFVGKTGLKQRYISDRRDFPVRAPAVFDIFGFTTTEYIVDDNRKAITAPIKATELIKMEGISDQSIFSYNVRGPLGKTNVNKDIVRSIRDSSKHRLFPLFHNGITIIAKQLNKTDDQIEIKDYYVVNGCQSLTALYTNSSALTDDLRIITRIVQFDPASEEAGMITAFSNNQNGVKPRDSKSNNAIQIRLRNEFLTKYKGKYAYEIKRGERAGEGTIISNEDAGLYLLAFDLHEPWSTHQRYSVFEDKHSDLFGRPNVTADYIVMCHGIAEVVQECMAGLENGLFAKYTLTKYMIMHIVRQILERDALSDEMFADPSKFVKNDDDRNTFRECIKAIVSDIVIDLNGEITTFGDSPRYRDNLKSATWVRKVTAEVVADHLKLLSRKRIKSFSEEWNDRRATR